MEEGSKSAGFAYIHKMAIDPIAGSIGFRPFIFVDWTDGALKFGGFEALLDRDDLKLVCPVKVNLIPICYLVVMW